MKLLVTGGAGFIGANFVNYWMSEHSGDEITVLDKLTYAGNLDRLNKVSDLPGYNFVQGDIQDFDLARKLCEGVDTLVHFAAESHVDRSLGGLEAEKLFLRTNAEGTATLLHAAHEAGVRRFHHVSTDEVFGELELEGDDKFDEHTPYAPKNPYSISKATSDFIVQCFARTHGLEITISNCTNNYGPYQTPEKMIPRSIALLSQNRRIQLYTDAQGNPGRNVRDWLYVEDHCRGIEAVLLKGTPGQTYCFGGNSEMTNYELVERILKVMSEIKGQGYSMDSHVAFVKDRPGHDLRYAMSTAKVQDQLGWQPQHSFEQGFDSTVRWYLSDEGQAWLEAYKTASDEVRRDQGKVTGDRV